MMAELIHNSHSPPVILVRRNSEHRATTGQAVGNNLSTSPATTAVLMNSISQEEQRLRDRLRAKSKSIAPTTATGGGSSSSVGEEKRHERESGGGAKSQQQRRGSDSAAGRRSDCSRGSSGGSSGGGVNDNDLDDKNDRSHSRNNDNHNNGSRSRRQQPTKKLIGEDTEEKQGGQQRRHRSARASSMDRSKPASHPRRGDPGDGGSEGGQRRRGQNGNSQYQAHQHPDRQRRGGSSSSHHSRPPYGDYRDRYGGPARGPPPPGYDPRYDSYYPPRPPPGRGGGGEVLYNHPPPPHLSHPYPAWRGHHHGPRVGPPPPHPRDRRMGHYPRGGESAADDRHNNSSTNVDDFGRHIPSQHGRLSRSSRSRSPSPRGRASSSSYSRSLSRSRSFSRSTSRSSSSASSSAVSRTSHDRLSGRRLQSHSPPLPAPRIGGEALRSRSRSRSRGRDKSSYQERPRHHNRSHRRTPSISPPPPPPPPRRSSLSSSSSDDSSSSSDDDSMASSTSSRASKNGAGVPSEEYTKDQRTVFVTQLVMRTTERDLHKYFRGKGLKVNEVILLRDKRSGNHKGCAYVELRRMEDVAAAVALSGQAPTFQRFPMLVKASEAEKNYAASTSQLTLTAPVKAGPITGPNGKLIESQRVYVGSLDHSITQEHLFAIFQHFGHLEKVALQVDISTALSKGYAFLTFRDPKESNLAIQSMSNQVLAGRPLKTGWANHVPSHAGVEIVTSDEFPPDAAVRAQRAYQVLVQLSLGVPVTSIVTDLATTPSVSNATFLGGSSTSTSATGTATVHSAMTVPAASRVATVAEARASLAAAAAATAAAGVVSNGVLSSVPLGMMAAAAAAASAVGAVPAVRSVVSLPDATQIGRADRPTKNLLIQGMYDKDEETEPDWPNDIRREFELECNRFGTITAVIVMDQDPGGKIYASFDTIQGAQNCASNLAGRWFDQRQLRVEYVDDHDIPVRAPLK